MAFPIVGLQVILDVKSFQNQYNRIQKTLDDLTKTFQGVGEGAKKSFTADQDLRIRAAQASVKEYEKALNGLAQQYAQVNAIAQKWGGTADPRVLQAITDQYKQEYQGLTAANKELAAAQQTTATGLASLSSSFLTGAAVVAGFAIGIAATVSIVQKAITSYVEFADTIHGVATAMGVSMAEASAWAKTARDLDLSTDVMARGAAAFERQVESLKLAQLEGTEVNNNFSRALSYLGISMRDEMTGAYKPSIQLFNETVVALQALSNESTRTGLTYILTGRQNRAMTEIMADSLRTMDEQRKMAERLGVVLGQDDKEALLLFQQASSDAKDGLQGLTNVIARNFIKAATAALGLVTQWTIGMRMLYSSFASAYVVISELATGTIKLNEIVARQKEVYQDMMGVQSEADKLAEQRALKEAAAASAIMDAEEARAHAMNKEIDALKELSDARDKAFQSYQRGLEDLARSEDRAAMERGLRAGWEAEDTQRKNLQRRNDINLDYQRKLQDIERGAQQKIQDQRKEQQRKLEDLERQHQLRLMQIQLAYTDAVEEALRSNDTVAILRAMRERKRALRDEELKQTEQRDSLQRDYQQRQEDQAAELQRQRDEAKRNYEQALADLQVAIQLETEEKQRQADRDAVMRRLQHQWALEDLKRQYDQQLADAQAAYEKQRTEYAQFLTDMGTTAAQGIITISNQIAAAVTAGSATVLSAEEQWLQRHFYLMTEAVTSSIGLGREEQWIRRHQFFAEGGIDVAASGAKTATYGEAGPEMAMFIPLQHSMNISHHFGNLGLSLNGQSLGGGSRQQMEDIAWAVLGQLPDILKGKR